MKERVQEIITMLHIQLPELNKQFFFPTLLEEVNEELPTPNITRVVENSSIEILREIEIKKYRRLITYVKALLVCVEEGRMTMTNIQELVPYIVRRLETKKRH